MSDTPILDPGIIDGSTVENTPPPVGEFPDDDAIVEGGEIPQETIVAAEIDEDQLPIEYDPFVIPLIGAKFEKIDEALHSYVNTNYSDAAQVAVDIRNPENKLHRLSLDRTALEDEPTLEALLDLLESLPPEQLARLTSQEDKDHPFRYRGTIPTKSKVSDTDSLPAFMRKVHQIQGTAPRVPLVHSGITVELQSPGSLLSAINMNIQLTNAIQEYGTALGGLYFTNESFFMYKMIWDTIIADNITWASIKDRNWKRDLPKYISLNDFDTLLVAIAHLQNPDGYPDFTASCLSPNCTHTTKLNIIVRNIIRTNEHLLATRHPGAHEHMHVTAQTNTLIDPSVLLSYKNKVSPPTGRIFQVGNSIIFLAVPTLDDTFTAGAYYAGILQTHINGSAPHMAVAVQNSLLGTVSHWVSRIVTYRDERSADSSWDALAADPNTPASSENILLDAVDRRAIIEQLLVIGSNDGEHKLYDYIEKYAMASRITIPALEDSPCPVCGSDGASLGINNTGFRVINPLHLFFSSTRRSLVRADTRKSVFKVI